VSKSEKDAKNRGVCKLSTKKNERHAYSQLRRAKGKERWVGKSRPAAEEEKRAFRRLRAKENSVERGGQRCKLYRGGKITRETVGKEMYSPFHGSSLGGGRRGKCFA